MPIPCSSAIRQVDAGSGLYLTSPGKPTWMGIWIRDYVSNRCWMNHRNLGPTPMEDPLPGSQRDFPPRPQCHCLSQESDLTFHRLANQSLASQFYIQCPSCPGCSSLSTLLFPSGSSASHTVTLLSPPGPPLLSSVLARNPQLSLQKTKLPLEETAQRSPRSLWSCSRFTTGTPCLTFRFVQALLCKIVPCVSRAS